MILYATELGTSSTTMMDRLVIVRANKTLLGEIKNCFCCG
jgi:hypothetical protein